MGSCLFLPGFVHISLLDWIRFKKANPSVPEFPNSFEHDGYKDEPFGCGLRRDLSRTLRYSLINAGQAEAINPRINLRPGKFL